jgi:hypothetical protein
MFFGWGKCYDDKFDSRGAMICQISECQYQKDRFTQAFSFYLQFHLLRYEIKVVYSQNVFFGSQLCDLGSWGKLEPYITFYSRALSICKICKHIPKQHCIPANLTLWLPILLKLIYSDQSCCSGFVSPDPDLGPKSKPLWHSSPGLQGVRTPLLIIVKTSFDLFTRIISSCQCVPID